MKKHFAFHNSTTPVLGTPREGLENYTTPTDKISLNGLETTKVKSGGASMMLKPGMEVAQYDTIFNYGPQRPQKDLKYQDRIILAGPGVNPAPNFFLPGHSKEKVGKETPHRYVDHEQLRNIVDHHSG